MKLPGQDAIARQADEHFVTYKVKLPRKLVEHPFRQVAKRLSIALLVLVVTAVIVYADHDGYTDNSDGSVTCSTPSTTPPSPSPPPDTVTSRPSATPPG